MRGKDSQQNELFDAARRGDIERLNLWLNSKKNHRPRTPLNFLRSVQGGPRPPTSWLFSLRDASNGYTALHLAALHGHADAVLTLIEADASLLTARDRRGCLPLHLAAWNGHLPAVEALLNADRSTVDIVNNAKESSLHFASQHGHAKVVSALLQRQADAKALNARGETALDLAARFGRANVVRLLVSNCPELALQSAVECVDSSSVYPLHSAARNGHIDCLAILIDSGFDVDFVTDQGTALHVAALFGKVAIVKLLLEKDISVDIRDGQGRTVLEVLDQHENEKATDLTQMMQSRDAWSECRKLIQGHIASKQQQQLNVAVYANGEETPEKLTPNQNGGSQYQNVSSVSPNRDVIWRPLPEAVANRLATTAPRSPNRSKGDHHQSASGDRYHPPSMQAELVHMNVGDDMNDNASTISLSTLRETMSSRGSGLTSPVGRFPTRPLDGDGNRPANRATINGPPCSYQAPATYDAWEPPAKRYDNLAGTTTHPHLAYDNVPSNLLVYDNAPPPGHRRWEHDCHHDHNSAPDCKHPKRERTSSDTTAIELNKLSIAVGDLNHHDATKSDSASPQRRPGSRASVVTFACSTLERSITPNHSDSPPTPTGRAPLALPEELGGSTTTSIVSSNASPSRWSTPGPPGLSRHSLNDSYDRRSTSTVDQTSDHVTIISTSTSTPDAPPPPAWTSESRIFDTLYSNDSLRHSSERSVSPDLLTHISREQETQAELLSPISTDCSECAGSPSASMSVGGSPTKRSIVERQYSTEQRSDASIEVKMRPASRRTSTDDATAGLNESAEWQKINDIMESFGGAICRESIFADRFEPQVAVYLRDRRSHALTLQLNKATIVEDDDPLASPLLTQVAEWLRLTVALPDWAPVAHLLDSHGYDRLQFLRSTLNQRTLRDLGVGKEAQSKIFAALQSTPSAVPSAHDFTY
uniref:Uncharacterized protein n=1 Tax=Plectus sambesii TaxID=2011161 RepID=A0A914X7S8_9BILA